MCYIADIIVVAVATFTTTQFVRPLAVEERLLCELEMKSRYFMTNEKKKIMFTPLSRRKKRKVPGRKQKRPWVRISSYIR